MLSALPRNERQGARAVRYSSSSGEMKAGAPPSVLDGGASVSWFSSDERAGANFFQKIYQCETRKSFKFTKKHSLIT
jgi:hypothetical protein